MNLRELQTGEIWLNHPEENKNFRNNQYRKMNKQIEIKSNKYNAGDFKKKNENEFNKNDFRKKRKNKRNDFDKTYEEQYSKSNSYNNTFGREFLTNNYLIYTSQNTFFKSDFVNLDPTALQRSSDESSHEGMSQDDKGKNKLSINSMINDKVRILLLRFIRLSRLLFSLRVRT